MKHLHWNSGNTYGGMTASTMSRRERRRFDKKTWEEFCRLYLPEEYEKIIQKRRNNALRSR